MLLDQHDGGPNISVLWVYSFSGLVSIASGALNFSSRVSGASALRAGVARDAIVSLLSLPRVAGLVGLNHNHF